MNEFPNLSEGPDGDKSSAVLGKLSNGTLFMELLLESLRSGNEKMVALATELTARSGTDPVPRLLQEAADPKNRPTFRVRLLNVVERIGAISDPDAFFDLQFLTRDKNIDVRQAASRVLRSLRPHTGAPPGIDRPPDSIP